MAVLSDLPQDDSLVSAARFATSVGLSIEPLTPAFEQLVTINLPALVRLEGKNGELWAALLGVDGDRVIITDGSGGTVAISRGYFEKRYRNRAVLLWLDPAPDQDWLKPQARGRRVRELQANLRALGLLEAETSGVYGPETAETVVRLQRASGLLIDGIAGPQVRMVLTAWLPQTPTPSLASQPFPSSIRSRILSAAADVNPTPPARKTVARIVREEPPGIEVETTVPSRESIVENPEEAISAGQRVLVEDLVEPEYKPMLAPPESAPGRTVTAPSSTSSPVVPRDPVIQSDAFEEASEAP